MAMAWCSPSVPSGRRCSSLLMALMAGLLAAPCYSLPATSNVTVCERGWYLPEEGGGCLKCEVCPHGWGAARLCSQRKNTVCRPCPPGTFSGVVSPSAPCALCSVCRQGQAMLQECTNIQDTICIDRNLYRGEPVFAAEGGEEEAPQDELTKSEERSRRREPLAWLAGIAVVGALAAGALGLLRAARHRVPAKPDRSTDTQTALLPPPPGGPRISPFIVTSQPSVPSKHAKVFSYLVSATNSSKMHELEAKLSENGASEWKELAHHLGYSPSSIKAFEHIGKRQKTPAYHLLTDWCESEQANPGALAQALKKMGRQDLAYLVEPLQTSAAHIV